MPSTLLLYIIKTSDRNIMFNATKIDERVFEAQSVFLVSGVEVKGLLAELSH